MHHYTPPLQFLFCKIAVVYDTNLAYFSAFLNNSDRSYLDHIYLLRRESIFQVSCHLPLESLLNPHHCLHTNNYMAVCVPYQISLLTSAIWGNFKGCVELPALNRLSCTLSGTVLDNWQSGWEIVVAIVVSHPPGILFSHLLIGRICFTWQRWQRPDIDCPNFICSSKWSCDLLLIK